MSENSVSGNDLIGPCAVGTGLKHDHAADIFEGGKSVDFFEIHAENYMGAGGPPHHLLRRIREDYPLSIHGVGMSIGGAGPLDCEHLRRLSGLVLAYRPALFSEHLAWSSHDGVFLNDLLPLPYNATTLSHVCAHIDQVQDTLGMQMLLENPSTYITFAGSTMSEIDFLRDAVRRTGCGLLLDVNNVYVSSVNHRFDAAAYIDAFPIEHVGEFHLAGFAEDRDSDGARLLIDAHDCPVSESVWRLYRRALGRTATAPTLIEWDKDVPDFSVVANEADRARDVIASLENAAHSMAAA
ncbi:MAG: DUF692 domain-containing protein [Pseudorhodoplanes sp.]